MDVDPGALCAASRAWQDIAQTVSLTGPTVRVTVREARAVLTG